MFYGLSRHIKKAKQNHFPGTVYSRTKRQRTFRWTQSGFTIVELLVVIVVIGILAAITIVSYSGITQRATVASVQSDLGNASKKMKLYYTLYNSYPTALDASNCPTAPTADSGYCIQASSGGTIAYSSIHPSTFHLTITKGTTSYSITDSSAPAVATTANGSAIGSACPTGYIPVPGSGTYGTNDFCVMKYEAKCANTSSPTVGLTTPTTGSNTYNNSTTACTSANNLSVVSTTSGYPIANISQANAITYSQNACSGCHLMTEAEWMTIAQNVLSVSSNWSGGTVGNGYIYSGHNDAAPNSALVADANDSNGYYGETNTGGNQRRTLTLTNGQVIWDLAGDVWEWTNATIAGGQQSGFSGESAYAWKQWDSGSLLMSGLPSASQPSSTKLSGIAYNSSAGIGQLYSNYGEAGARVFLRGGGWSAGGGTAGVLTLHFYYASGDINTPIGFRIAK